MRAFAAALILFAAAALPVRAETDWHRQLDGLDGVVIACISSTGESYAERICDTLSKNAHKTLEDEGVRVAVAGYYREGGPAPELPGNMVRSLQITIYLRGTPGGALANTAAILVRSRASIAYDAAVEIGEGGAGRRGDLVVWEQSTVGSGPVMQLEAAITNAMNDKLAGLIAHVVKGWE